MQGMGNMEYLARVTAMVGDTMVLRRRMSDPTMKAVGAEPRIPQAKKQGMMTLKMQAAQG